MRPGLQGSTEYDREDDRKSHPDEEVLGPLPHSCSIRWLNMPHATHGLISDFA
jgi:hypothetical protein